MIFTDPLSKDKADFKRTIDKISAANSSVGIDAQLTHAIIIDYLQQINRRLERMEQSLSIKDS